MFPLHIAVKQGYSLLVSVMLQVDGNLVNVQDDKGNTLLHHAAGSGKAFYYCIISYWLSISLVLLRILAGQTTSTQILKGLLAALKPRFKSVSLNFQNQTLLHSIFKDIVRCFEPNLITEMLLSFYKSVGVEKVEEYLGKHEYSVLHYLCYKFTSRKNIGKGCFNIVFTLFCLYIYAYVYVHTY